MFEKVENLFFFEMATLFTFFYQYSLIFSHSDHEAQPWEGPKADISEAFTPTGNGGAGAEPPLTMILIKNRLAVRRCIGIKKPTPELSLY